MKNYWVYIMSGRTQPLYDGVTDDIERRKIGAFSAGEIRSPTDRWSFSEMPARHLTSG